MCWIPTSGQGCWSAGRLQELSWIRGMMCLSPDLSMPGSRDPLIAKRGVCPWLSNLTGIKTAPERILGDSRGAGLVFCPSPREAGAAVQMADICQSNADLTSSGSTEPSPSNPSAEMELCEESCSHPGDALLIPSGCLECAHANLSPPCRWNPRTVDIGCFTSSTWLWSSTLCLGNHFKPLEFRWGTQQQ